MSKVLDGVPYSFDPSSDNGAMRSKLIFGGIIWNIANCVEGRKGSNCNVATTITQPGQVIAMHLIGWRAKFGATCSGNVLKTRQLDRFRVRVFLKLCIGKINQNNKDKAS